MGDGLHTPDECGEIAFSPVFFKDVKEEKSFRRGKKKRMNKPPNKKLAKGTL